MTAGACADIDRLHLSDAGVMLTLDALGRWLHQHSKLHTLSVLTHTLNPAPPGLLFPCSADVEGGTGSDLDDSEGWGPTAKVAGEEAAAEAAMLRDTAAYVRTYVDDEEGTKDGWGDTVKPGCAGKHDKLHV